MRSFCVLLFCLLTVYVRFVHLSDIDGHNETIYLRATSVQDNSQRSVPGPLPVNPNDWGVMPPPFPNALRFINFEDAMRRADRYSNRRGSILGYFRHLLSSFTQCFSRSGIELRRTEHGDQNEYTINPDHLDDLSGQFSWIPCVIVRGTFQKNYPSFFSFIHIILVCFRSLSTHGCNTHGAFADLGCGFYI